MNKAIATFWCSMASLALSGLSASAQEDIKSIEASGEKRITLNMAKGDIRDALRLVAEQGGLNLVIGPQVEGEVSIYLTDAAFETALRAITVSNGFVYVVENNVISVSRPSDNPTGADAIPPLVTKIFTLRSQDAERVRDALEFALTPFGKMKALNENSDNFYTGQRLSDLSGEIGNENGNNNNNIRNNNQNGNNNINQQQAGVGLPPLNARKLVVTDIAENVRRIGKLIGDLDKLPPQVLIEARIVEMSTDLQRQLGIDWDVNVLANGPILNHELPLQWRAGFSSGNQIRRTPTGTAQSTAGLALGVVDFSRFLGLLRIHQQDNAIRLLANPRLLVFNNHSASILVGERYPILESTVTDFGTVTEAFDTYIPVGIQLEVTPTIMVDGRLSLMVHPVTSALGDDVIGTTGLRVARIRTRELSTRVVMEDGQTIVLGGLISDRKTRVVNKIPGLGDMWGLSVLFRQENPQSERVDLLVFLTAHVEGGTEMSERDLEIFEKYRPHFKQVERLQDVQLHFEVPTEYETPKPMFGDPPVESLESDEETELVEEDATDEMVTDEESERPETESPVARSWPSKVSANAPRRLGDPGLQVGNRFQTADQSSVARSNDRAFLARTLSDENR
ncbi:MAG: hypothetical protein MI923_14715 [Phycisphaerales bacterium]|nr:hypothetical protein [Phycisphaerales bacterium]